MRYQAYNPNTLADIDETLHKLSQALSQGYNFVL